MLTFNIYPHTMAASSAQTKAFLKCYHTVKHCNCNTVLIINALGVCSVTEEYLGWVVSSWELPLLGWVDSLPVLLLLENQWKIQAPVSVLQIG